MADHHESGSIADFDVVRSTQFVDDVSCGVRLVSSRRLSLHIIVVCRSRIMECMYPSVRLRQLRLTNLALKRFPYVCTSM